MKERIQPQFYWELTDLESNKNEIQNLLDAKIKEKISGVNRGEQVRVTKQWQKRYHQFTDNEKQIRLFKNCDQVQWMMVMDLYQKLEDNDQSKNAISLFHDQGFQLKEMKPDAEKGILNNIEKTSFRMLSANGTEKEIVGHVKIKNYGRFRALMKDRRVPGLLSYIDAYRIEEEVIRRELDEFERVRLVLLEKIHELEKQVISMYRLARNEFGFVPHEEILSQLNLEVQTKEKLNAIRNMVCHSQYPKQELFTDDVDGAFDEDKLIIPQISKWAVERYDAL